MKIPTATIAKCLATVALAGFFSGCAVRGEGHYDEVDVVDAHGWHHHGYYDEHRDWHGGYYDEQHQFHDDPHDWHHDRD
jgi:hypothetical protein